MKDTEQTESLGPPILGFWGHTASEGGGSELNIDQCSGATATVPFSER